MTLCPMEIRKISSSVIIQSIKYSQSTDFSQLPPEMHGHLVINSIRGMAIQKLPVTYGQTDLLKVIILVMKCFEVQLKCNFTADFFS